MNKSIFNKINHLFSVNHGSLFRVNTIHMLRANVIAQIVVLLSTPLLSRLYSPSDFGKFSFFSATVAILISFTTGRFDWSIPNAKSAGAAGALFKIGFLCTMATSLTVAILITILHLIDLPIITESKMDSMVFLLPLAMLSSGIIQLFDGWFVRSGHLKTVGTAKIIQSLSNTALSLLSGLSKFGAMGLIISSIASSIIAVVILIKKTRQIQYRFVRTSKIRMSAMLQRFRSEATLSTAVSITNTLSNTASIFMIASFFTLQELGWYALMHRLALAPVGLISSSIGKSFWSTAAGYTRVKAYGELRKLYLRTTLKLCIFIVPIIIGCGMAPFLIGPLFGTSEWTPAGYILLAMAPHIIGAIVFSPTNHLIVYGRQSYQLISDLIVILLTAISIFVTAKYNLGIVACTAAISFTMLAGYIFRFYLHLYANAELRNSVRKI
jgi:O-antigen/teichoic acid export membrane protein